jgi:hypothetical protein
VIQPPGYWLFNLGSGLFLDSIVAISVMNVLFSVAGVAVFYYSALLFAEWGKALVSALAYSAVLYILA